eukprot:g39773.t1
MGPSPSRESSAAMKAIGKIPTEKYGVNLLGGSQLDEFTVPVIANIDKIVADNPLVGFVDSDFAGEKISRESCRYWVYLRRAKRMIGEIPVDSFFCSPFLYSSPRSSPRPPRT